MPVSEEKVRKIRDITSEVLGKVGSENYRQKLVFDLLNAIKANDQRRFFWILLRALNAHLKDSSKARELARLLGKTFPLPESDFEKVSYSIVFGIMAGGES
ncbi:MAG TPA: hypothetical protein EYH24_06530 [Thermococcus paralvinellae]|uniref:Uncharacterized protein n=1 Tax=Thermococcus paralvinellae TaxID=582419 RepID=A0A832ZG92_9EURY|nr:hypothetical protein [Thermococcus paralvinellae]